MIDQMAQQIEALCTDILGEDFYYGSLEDKVKLIRGLAKSIRKEVNK